MLNTKRRRPNLSEIAYDEIKDMILHGVLTQGQRILLDEMSEKLNLSVTPIREALNKLAQEELVNITPRTCHEVVSLDASDVKDILELRLLLESFALQTAGNNLSQFPVQHFREIFQKSFFPECIQEFIEADDLFHQSIIEISTNKKLAKLYSYIHNLIRVISIPAAHIETRLSVAPQEHLAILDAIGAQNVALAVERVSTHIRNVESAMMRVYQSPDS